MNERDLNLKGEWITHKDWHPNLRYGCSVCGNLTKERVPYCPSCKAQMRGCPMELPFFINGKYQGVICDEGTVYEKNGRYYIQWHGLGVTRRISKNQAQILYNSDERIRGEE